MKRLEYLILVSAIISLSIAVKINMQGSVSLGKDVLQSISHYMIGNGALSLLSRRSNSDPLAPSLGSEKIKWTIHSANIGKGVKIYHGAMGNFIKEYIIILSTAIESIFEGIITHKEEETKGSIFIEQLKPVLTDIHDILMEFDTKIAKDKELFEWRTIIKRIAARYQNATIKFVDDRIDGDPQDISNVKKKLIQRLVVAVVLVQNKYEGKLCEQHQICETDLTVTTALSKLLGEFENIEQEKVMEFMKYFYESLPENLFYFLNMDTAHELQVILSDLSFAKNAPTKTVLLSVKKAVDARLNLLKSKTEMSKAYDQQLVNAILSDMDFFYHSNHNRYAFDSYLDQFSTWLKTGGKFGQQTKAVMKEIKEQLDDQPRALVEKLEYETRVFLELTVDPDK